MKLSELGRLIGRHLAQGKGDWEVNIFQWEHQSQPVTDVLERHGIVEFYSGTDGKPASTQKIEEKQELEHDDIDDLI